ncbi:hypothetical protein NDN16_18355 [Aureimonas altamirensis]|uniref:hypothetical protein n=1 Tax=Aureimonas altamirensis TaxID=370622 RepID=UPI0020368759|nr:hypothetical protein [Aureimonas altamirensis]MCM2505632.1 hypothetical protein [Aureimonas altamirensis]
MTADKSLTDLHRLSVVRLNATDRLDAQAFRNLLEALRAVAPSDASRNLAREASATLRIYVEFARSDDADLLALADAFEAVSSPFTP